MKKLLLILLVGLIPRLCSGQNADNIRFEMIKETINFLGKDSKISKSKSFSLNCNKIKLIEKYACLEASITDQIFNGKKALLARVRKWDEKKKGNTSADLLKLKTSIFDDIINPVEKQYRQTEIPEYSAYLQKVDELIAGVKSNSTITRQSTTDQVGGPNDLDLQSTQAIIDKQQRSLDSLKSEMSKYSVSTPNNNIAYIALAAAIIGVIIGFVSYFNSGKLLKQYSLPSNTSSSETGPSVTDLKKIEEELTRKIVTLKESLETLKTELKESDRSVQNKLTELSGQSREVIFDNISNKSLSTKPKVESVQQQQPAISSFANSAIMYAKFSDIEAGGFSTAILHDTQNGERTFELSIIGDEAVYGVSNDLRAQRYALQNFEYLDAACNVKGTPQSNGRIITHKQGNLSRSAEGNWMIVTKADIELK